MGTLYTSLRSHHIRLLRLTDNTGLNAAISEHSIEDAPPYACLSYLWGEEIDHSDGDKITHVVVNTHSLRIQKNLYDALTTLGSLLYSKGLYLWIDRICIDQSNLDERAQQVKLMKTLYEQAKEVLAWIGSSGAQTDLLTWEMLKTVATFSRHTLNTTHTRPTLDWLLGLIRLGPHFQNASTEHILTAWAALIALLKRPYWSRTWIHQEATLPNVMFFCGHHQFTWKELQAANDFHGTYGGFKYLSSDYLLIWADGVSMGSPVLDLIVAYENRCLVLDGSQPQVVTSTTLVRQLRQANCKDARDKIFAMLPHATDIDLQNGNVLLTVDYNKPTVNVYLDFTRYCVQSGRGLEILGYVCAPAALGTEYRPPRAVGELRLPSWVPDWRIPNRIRPLNSTGVLHGDYSILYDPCPNTVVEADITGAELNIRGFICDTVVDIVSTSGRQEIPGGNVLTTWSAELHRTYGTFDRARFLKLVLADAYQTESEAGLTANARGGETYRPFLDQSPADLEISGTWVRSQMHHALRGVCRDRRAGYTEARRLGIFPEAAVPGDLVAAFYGGHTLYVIRPTEEQEKYTFVGECYVENMMDGQAVALAEAKGIVPRTLCLI